MLGPDAELAEMEAVVAPEDDDGVFREAEPVDGGDDLADLGIHITRGRVVAVDELTCEIIPDFTFFRDRLVSGNLTSRTSLDRPLGRSLGGGIDGC